MNQSSARAPSPVSPRGPLRQLTKGFLVAALTFAVLGTVSALWNNPLFIRMTPAGAWEITALLLLSLLAGLFIAIHRPFCSVRSAGAGGVIGFLGIACPTCNTVLMLVFGGELLLAYFEPIRLYVAAVGVLILAVATGREIALRRRHPKDSFIEEAGP